MNTRELELVLTAADPIGDERLEWLDIEAMEAELLADIDGEQPASSPPAAAAPHRRPRRLALSLALAALAAVAALGFVLAGGASEQPSRAYGAELVRFAESTPLILLEGPGWRVQNANEISEDEGTIEFVTGKPIPYESVQISGDEESGWREAGMLPPSVRQRRVELAWSRRSLADTVSWARKLPHPHGRRWVKLPVLESTAQVDTRAEFYVNQGGPGNRQMSAFWSEDGYLLEMRAAVPDLAAFEERLGWLTRVDSEAWLDAMPAKVVKAADHDAAVREMLRGIPTPAGFKPAMIADEGLTTDRYQVGAAVTGTVSCLWFLQWGEARRAGDRAKAAEAERAMATSKRWPILREMAKDGAYPDVVWELSAAMPSGYWEWAGRRHRLLPHAEGLGCARRGLPLLPWKQERQRERGQQQQ